MSESPATGRLPLRPLYTITELARAIRMERRRLRRMLDARGVEVFHVGGRACVPLSEIIAKLKPLWDSVHAVGAVPEEDNSDPYGSE